MQTTAYVRNPFTSPTVRACDPSINVAATESCASSSASARAYPSNPRRSPLTDLPTFKQYRDGSTQETRPGQSFTTFKWITGSNQQPLEHPHTVTDCAYFDSMTLPTRLMARLEAEFGKGPAMHFAEDAARALDQNVGDKLKLDAALQRLENADAYCQKLHDDYQAFADRARVLLSAFENAHPGQGLPDSGSNALSGMIESVWPTLRFKDHGEKSAWLSRVTRDPKHFVAQSYDVLDLGLAQAGIAISLAKMDVHESIDLMRPAQREEIYGLMRNTDRAYTKTREAFTDGSIPVNPDLMKGHSLVATLRDLPGDGESSEGSVCGEIEPAAPAPARRPVPPMGVPASSWRPTHPVARRPASQPGCCVIS